MSSLVRELNYWISHMDRQHWVLVLAAAIVIGFFLLRSIGAKAHY